MVRSSSDSALARAAWLDFLAVVSTIQLVTRPTAMNTPSASALLAWAIVQA